MNGPEAPRLAATEGEAEAYAALLRREQQLDTIQRSLGWRLLSHYGPYKRRYVLPAWRLLRQTVARVLGNATTSEGDAYERWARFAEHVHDAVPVADGVPTTGASTDPLVTLIMTVDPAVRGGLGPAVGSIVAQRYARWELLLAPVGAASVAASPGVTWPDARISLETAVHANHALAATAAYARAAGEIVALVPADLLLVPDALGVAVRAFAVTGCDVLYGDEDERDERGERAHPDFKPGWSPDLLLSRMYWSRVAFFRRAILARVLPLDPAHDGAQAYDMALRLTEQPGRIAHVPRILAHVPVTGALGAATASARGREAGRRALESALARRGVAATVHAHGPAGYRVRREIQSPARISIVIPTRDGLAMLQRCLAAIARTDHPDVEVVIVDNGSSKDATLAFLASTAHTVVRAPGPFNFSRLNNLAVPHTTGRYLLFLNDDTEAFRPDWLRALEEHAQRPEVGAVGAKLLYRDGRIQHAGIAVGIGGLAGHPYRFARVAADDVRDVSAVTAACLMMRRDVFDAVGGFDERLPVNSNDVDLCLRLRARGWLVVYTPHAVLYHHESQTRGARAMPDDAGLMTRRWRGVLGADPYYSPNLDLAEESGAPDLSKPDGMVRLYAGATRSDGTLRLEAGRNVGQRFFATGADLTAIVLRATVAGADPERALLLTIRTSPETTESIRVVERAVVGQQADERWFCFEPLADSADRFWYFRVDVAEGHAATLPTQAVPSEVMGPCFADDAPTHGTLCFELYARAPYRVATIP